MSERVTRYVERPVASYRWAGWCFLVFIPPFAVDALVRTPGDASAWLLVAFVLAAVVAANRAYSRHKERIWLTSSVLRADGRRIPVDLLDLPRIAARHRQGGWPAGPSEILPVAALGGQRCALSVPLRFGSYYPVPSQDAGALADALGHLATEVAGHRPAVSEPVAPGVRCPSPFGTVLVDRTGPPRQVTVSGPGVPAVTLASALPGPPAPGDEQPWIGTRAANQLSLRLDGRPGTVRPRSGCARRATYQVRVTVDGHRYLLDPTGLAKARVLRDGRQLVRMSWFRPSPLKPYPTVDWDPAAAPADVSLSFALAAAFGVGEAGFILHFLELFGEIVQLFSLLGRGLIWLVKSSIG